MVHMDTITPRRRPVVVADRNIPLLGELLGEHVDLRLLTPDQITPRAVRDADALITRTRTLCNAALLDGSNIHMVATATIGTDHIDFDYCASHGITAVSAPGCNAPAVAQYVWASVLRLVADRAPCDITVGIVGVGNVGRIVEQWGRAMGFKILLCDPPRAEREQGAHFVALETIAAQCDVITFHTPLTVGGRHPSYHIASEAFFASLARNPIIVNSARGPVVDTRALIDAITTGRVSHAIVDCWEGEPDIDRRLLDLATIATPHIAGYSLEGKTRASLMVAKAVARHLCVDCSDVVSMPSPAPLDVTQADVVNSYDPVVDSLRLKASPETFELQRNKYPLRHEL